MTPKNRHPGGSRQQLLALLCAFLIGPGDAFAYAAFARTAVAQAPVSQTADTATPISANQLDSLVSPIALYPDPLLAQVLAASTYPLELMQLQQWLGRNPGLKDKALADAVAQQPWDPSVQAMAGLPDVVKLLTDNVQWTTDLGNAFLSQEGDVMKAVQRMRQSAWSKGTLKSNEQQVVQSQAADGSQYIVIEQANPQVIYVPQYTPAAIWGTPVYPYPTMSYPWGWGVAGAALSFGAGVAMGAFWGGGGWGWGCGWGGGNVTVNNFNNFNRAAAVRNGTFNRNVRNGTWQHNAAHRGGTPYANRATANRFGGTTRGDSLANRQAGARQQLNRQGGQLGNRGTSGIGNRPGGGQGIGNRPGGGQGIGNRPGGGLGNRGSSGIGGGGNRGTSGIGGGNIGNRPGAGGGGINRPTQLPSGGDRIGSRDLSRGSGSGAFGGGSRGFDGGRARSDFSRGSSSFGSRGGGGFSRGGGGGFSRGGGGFSRGGGGFSRGGGGGGRSRGGGGRGRR
jgi:Protein of unknown function (DUF3300)